MKRSNSSIKRQHGFTLLELLVVLVIIAVSIPIYMAIWFAPSLVIFHDMKPVDALKTSFFACLASARSQIEPLPS